MFFSGVLLVLSACFGGLGLVFWLIGFAIGRGRRRGWVSTVGRWTRLESGLTRAWQVEYVADGHAHRVTPAMNATMFAPTGTVAVAYDPHRPHRAVIDTFFHRGGAMKTVGAVLLAIAVVLALAAVALLPAGG
ncbi:hypothetical protein [Microbacterium sp. Marseille-Q6965]|uniref:DUF3592 domain-containing protein n=1 Tax=Microbacterium sp. Marseille-Q6965 TaxID=2965072 RepID=UPI0021B7F9D6|nr:hypothetical protein [Microbacterium sp. Marseille-Q6965]